MINFNFINQAIKYSQDRVDEVTRTGETPIKMGLWDIKSYRDPREELYSPNKEEYYLEIRGNKGTTSRSYLFTYIEGKLYYQEGGDLWEITE